MISMKMTLNAKMYDVKASCFSTYIKSLNNSVFKVRAGVIITPGQGS
jgi:hypothetical protein